MGAGAAIIGFFKALPELVGVLKDLREDFRELKNAQLERANEKQKEELNTIISEVERGVLSDEDRKRIVGKLNAIRRK